MAKKELKKIVKKNVKWYRFILKRKIIKSGGII